MDITNTTGQKTLSRNEQMKLDLQAKVRSKFGDEAPKKASDSDTVELSGKTKEKVLLEDTEFADIKNNDPNAEETQEKLKALLKSGAFHFSDKERSALSEILK